MQMFTLILCQANKIGFNQHFTYVNNHSFVQKTLLFCCHHKIMSAVFIVNNILQVNPWKEIHICYQVQCPVCAIYQQHGIDPDRCLSFLGCTHFPSRGEGLVGKMLWNRTREEIGLTQQELCSAQFQVIQHSFRDQPLNSALTVSEVELGAKGIKCFLGC